MDKAKAQKKFDLELTARGLVKDGKLVAAIKLYRELETLADIRCEKQFYENMADKLEDEHATTA